MIYLNLIKYGILILVFYSLSVLACFTFAFDANRSLIILVLVKFSNIHNIFLKFALIINTIKV